MNNTFFLIMTDRAFKSARVGVIELILYKNLAIGLVFTLILGIIYGICFNIISKFIPEWVLFWCILLVASLSGIWIVVLFPIEKRGEENKE